MHRAFEKRLMTPKDPGLYPIRIESVEVSSAGLVGSGDLLLVMQVADGRRMAMRAPMAGRMLRVRVMAGEVLTTRACAMTMREEPGLELAAKQGGLAAEQGGLAAAPRGRAAEPGGLTDAPWGREEDFGAGYRDGLEHAATSPRWTGDWSRDLAAAERRAQGGTVSLSPSSGGSSSGDPSFGGPSSGGASFGGPSSGGAYSNGGGAPLGRIQPVKRAVPNAAPSTASPIAAGPIADAARPLSTPSRARRAPWIHRNSGEHEAEAPHSKQLWAGLAALVLLLFILGAIPREIYSEAESEVESLIGAPPPLSPSEQRAP